MGKKLILVSVAVLVFTLVLVAFAGTALASYNFTTHTPDHSMVAGSKHDVSSSGGNPCESCHIPHGAQGAYLWAVAPHAIGVTEDAGATGAVGSQYSSDIKPLCYSCHDGTQVDPATGKSLAVGKYSVFSTDPAHFNHRTTAASYVKTGSTTPTGPGKDCDRCHDPHDDSSYDQSGHVITGVTSSFLKPEFKTRVYDQTGNVVMVNYTYGVDKNGVPVTQQTLNWWSPLVKGGNFCSSCHESNLPDATVATKAAGAPGSRSVHPVYQAAGTMVWDTTNPGTWHWDSATNTAVLDTKSTTAIVATTPIPGNVSTYPSSWPTDQIFKPALTDSAGNPTPDYLGTRVFAPATGLMVTTAPTAPALTDGTSVVECESCHAPHGANNGTVPNTSSSSKATTPVIHILNTQDEATACSSCHAN